MKNRNKRFWYSLGIVGVAPIAVFLLVLRCSSRPGSAPAPSFSTTVADSALPLAISQSTPAASPPQTSVAPGATAHSGAAANKRLLPRRQCPGFGDHCADGNCDDGCRHCACIDGEWSCSGETCRGQPACPVTPPSEHTACSAFGQLCAGYGECGPMCRCNGSYFECAWPSCACPGAAELKAAGDCKNVGLLCRYADGPCCRCVATAQDTMWVCHADICSMDL